MYVKSIEKVSEVNFLKSAKYVALTFQADLTTAGVVNNVLPAGSVYPANDATAKGITLYDVNVANGSQPVSVIVDGYILTDRLPVEPSADAIAAMTGIKLY